MADILYVVVTVAFFALAAGFVRVCDRIIGPDPTPTSDTPRPGQPIEIVETEPVATEAAR